MKVRMIGYLAVALLPLSSSALAGRHHVCYQDESIGGSPTAVWGCTADLPESCRVQRFTNGTPMPFTPPAQGGDYVKYQFGGNGLQSLDIQFLDGTGGVVARRPCEVDIKTGGAASPGAVLTGFTTDTEGLVTTAVWRLSFNRVSTPTSGTYFPLQDGAELQVPLDFVVVGGGVIGAEVPQGRLLVQSDRGVSGLTWKGSTLDNGAWQSSDNAVLAIGMRIRNLPSTKLAELMSFHPAPANPGPVAHPTNSAELTWGFTPLSGGVSASASASNPPPPGAVQWTTKGQYLTESAPAVCSGSGCCRVDAAGVTTCSSDLWKGASKDHMIARPGAVAATIYALPTTLQINAQNFCVQSKTVTATSGLAAHPTIDVGGLRGEYALTGIGATVNWKQPGRFLPPGNLLWKLEPRPDIGGASVASKDHMLSSPATITGYALGIKLVPVGAGVVCR